MFVDCWHDKKKEIIHVVERVDGKRVLKQYPAKYVLYYPDKQGKFVNIAGDKVSRVMLGNAAAFDKEKRIHSNKKLCESDYKPLNRCLEEVYGGQDGPDLHVAFFDIEVSYDKVKGFAPPSDPFNYITAITTYLMWMDVNITLCLKPEAMSDQMAQEICAKFENTILCDSEKQMLDMWLELIEDADVLSGWNSEGFDIPYTTNRITRVLGKEQTRRICLWDQYPKRREFEKYGKALETYDPVGRVHLDYLELYRKYNYHELPSYRLDYVGEIELGENKIHYEGTLDQLYNNDFEKFIAYNRQDVLLLKKLDDKLKFIELTNLIAHANTVTLRGTLGAVAVTDQAVINEAHSLGMVVPDRPRRSEDSKDNAAAGAYVAVPKQGMHEWIGSMDINSLYPSLIRALNMSPETIIGQVRQTRTLAGIDEFIADGKGIAEFWEGKFACFEYDSVMAREIGTSEVIDWTDGTSTQMSSAQVYDYVFHGGQPLMISGNGTIFKYDTKGVIPGLLERWYAERKVLQAKAKEAYGTDMYDFWDKRQLVKKINLNSAYGALLNAGSRFFDQRLGQSTTLCGRLVAKHMASQVNDCLTGNYEHMGKAIIYGDTDSFLGSSLIESSLGAKTVEELFNCGNEHWDDNGKEYAYHPNLMVMTYDPDRNEPYLGHTEYIYRHKVSKDLYEIEDELGNTITVTEDHSVMIERDGVLMEAKPADITNDDILISIVCGSTEK